MSSVNLVVEDKIKVKDQGQSDLYVHLVINQKGQE